MTQLQPDLRSRLRDLPSYRLLIALWGGLAVIDLGQVTRMPAGVQVFSMALLVALCSHGAGAGCGLLVAGVAWLLVNGFVVNAAGTLHLTGPGDALRLGLLASVGILAGRHRG